MPCWSYIMHPWLIYEFRLSLVQTGVSLLHARPTDDSKLIAYDARGAPDTGKYNQFPEQ